MNAECYRERLQDLCRQLDESEFKIASCLYKLLAQFNGRSVWLTDRVLSKGSGVGIRQIPAARKSLAKRGLIECQTVTGRGTVYSFPPILPGIPRDHAGELAEGRNQE